MTSSELWTKYIESGNRDEKHEAWAFCGGGKEADELLDLVKEGKKRGTASSLIAYKTENEEIPSVGDKSIILDSNVLLTYIYCNSFLCNCSSINICRILNVKFGKRYRFQ